MHLCFDHITEYDPDLVFDKHAIFSKKSPYIQVLIKNQSEMMMRAPAGLLALFQLTNTLNHL